jgi:flagellar protein FliS
MNRSYEAQQQTGKKSSDSIKLVLMMYDGSINFLNKAVEYAERGDVRSRNIYVNKARDIIRELDNAVNDEVGGEFSKNLKKLYSFMNQHLGESIQKNEIEGLDNVTAMLSDLRGSWQYIDDRLQNSPEYDQALQNAMVQ